MRCRSVSDSGNGFDAAGATTASANQSAFRATALGGTLEIDSQPGRGASVRLRVPLPARRSGVRRFPWIACMPSVWLIEDNPTFRRALEFAVLARPEMNPSRAFERCEEMRWSSWPPGPGPDVVLSTWACPASTASRARGGSSTRIRRSAFWS